MRLLTLLPLAVWLPAFAVAQTCYYPDGSEAPDQYPCTSDDGDTFCCPAREACLANKLCYFNSTSVFDDTFRHFYYRGSCTDKTWKSEGCPSFCVDFPEGRDLAWRCDESDDKYHCLLNYNEYTAGGEKAEAGCTGSSVFELPGPSNIITVMESPTTSSSQASKTSSDISTSEPPTSSSSSSSRIRTTEKAKVETTSTTSSSPPPSTTANTTGSNSPSGDPQSEGSSGSPGSSDLSNSGGVTNAGFSTGMGIGIGAGVGAVALLLLVALFFFLRRRKKEAKEKAAFKDAYDAKFDPYVGAGTTASARYEAPDFTQRYEAPDVQRHEAPDAQMYEAPDTTMRFEAPVVERRYELGGS